MEAPLSAPPAQEAGGGGREAVKNAQRDGHRPLHHFGCIEGQLSLPTSIPFPSVYL